MASRPLRLIFAVSAALQLLPLARAQGAAADYERARSFLQGNLQHSVYIADVNSHWIGKSHRFGQRCFLKPCVGRSSLTAVKSH